MIVKKINVKPSIPERDDTVLKIIFEITPKIPFWNRVFGRTSLVLDIYFIKPLHLRDEECVVFFIKNNTLKPSIQE